MKMNSVGLQQNFILFVENKNKEANINRRLCCEKCRFSTKDVELFERHVAHHEEVTFSCTLCSHVSYSRVESQRHSVKHKGSFPYRCNWCDYGAVRRDYMVKHIQRIHGKSADGGFTTDCAKEHLSQKGTTDLCSDTPRKFASCSKVKKPYPFLSVNQPRASAPYIAAKPVHQMTSNQTRMIYSTANQSLTASVVPITKTQIYSVPGPADSVTEVTQDIRTQPSVLVDEGDQNAGKINEYVERFAGKMSLEKNASPSALPRVHLGIYTDRTVPQRPQLQSHIPATAEKVVLQPKTIPKLQVGLPVGNNTPLKAFLSNTLESITHRTAEVRTVEGTPARQRQVHSGAVRNIPVVQEVQWSVPSGAHPSMPMEHFGLGASSIPHGTLSTEKLNRQKTHPSLPEKPSLEKLKSITQSSVQVELLAPLNQPIQHNRPLTVSCPEEITIPAGCLVELVEVKNVSGTRELELRLVPQLPDALPVGGLRGTTATSAAGRLSFKCRVTTEDDQQARLDHGATHKNGVPESEVKESLLKAHSTDITATIKDEPEVNENALCSKTIVSETSASLKAAFQCASRSVSKPAPYPSGSGRFNLQPHTAHTLVTNTPELVTPVLQMTSAHKTTSCSAASQSITTEGVKCDLRAVQALPNKREGAESYEGLPVISSVFSLCPVPEATLSQIHTGVGISDKHTGEALTSSNVRTNGNVKNVNDLAVFKHELKTEEETESSTKIVQNCSQKLVENEDKHTIYKEDTNISQGLVPETPDNMLEKSAQTCANDLKDQTGWKHESDARGIAASGPALNKNFTTQPNEKAETKQKVEDHVPVQRESSPASPMNPRVALVRIPRLESYSVLESAKNITDKLVEEESVTARPVLCCTSNQQNLQGTAIKLVLKRKRSETENKDSEQDFQPGLTFFDVHQHKKHKKGKKKAKKHRASKVRLDFHQLLQKSKVAKLWLTPLKEDQLVKLPGPNQPVVVLNHPNPPVQMVSTGDQTLKDYKWITSVHGLCPQPIKQCPSFIMKLKKVQGQKYQVTELVLKGVSEKMIL
ncbi:uncharacterized protein znf518b [Brachyhypopomus gauderio]|uniref:uncharacterized protein znf518b n=1 Tax=Brachyhypopomus gauderio TaxID=698409 RepID=UPI0040413EAD